MMESVFYKVVETPEVKQLWFDALQKNAFAIVERELSQSTKKGLVRFLRNDLSEDLIKMAKSLGLKFIPPPQLPLHYVIKNGDFFKPSKEFCSCLMKWYYSSLSYNRALRDELAEMKTIEEHGGFNELLDYFSSQHPDLALEEGIQDRVCIAAVILCNLRDSSNKKFGDFYRGSEILERRIKSIQNLSTDWPIIVEVVREAVGLNVINLFQTIINWK
jgi:hypothetical protein